MLFAMLLKPQYLAAGTAYGSAETLNWVVNEKRIAPHIPVVDKSGRKDGLLSRQDFHLTRRATSISARRASCCTRRATFTTGTTSSIPKKSDCGPCPLKPRCCPKAPERGIPRSIYEDARDVARALVGSATFEQSRRDRKRVEMLFAHLKRILRLGRLRLRGPRGAQDEFTLGAIAQTSAAWPSSLLDRRRRHR